MDTPFNERRMLSFWPLQLSGWAAFTGANLAALIPSLHARDYVAYRAMYLTVTFLGSFLMYPFCRWLRLSHVTLIRCLLASSLLGYVLAIPGSMAITWAEIHFGGASGGLRWQTVLANAVAVAFVYVAWSAFYFGIKHYQESEGNRIKLQAAETHARNAQLSALRYQLQPHFLFNTLNAISSLVVAEKTTLATQTIARLGTLLRLTLDAPEVHAISLDEELTVTEEYLQIEQIRFGEKLALSYAIQNEARSLLVPRFLLQPLVENAVRHGIARRLDGGEIKVSAESRNGVLSITIENEVGPVIERSGPKVPGKSKSGLGLANTELRLHQMYGDGGTIDAKLGGGFDLSSHVVPTSNVRAWAV